MAGFTIPTYRIPEVRAEGVIPVQHVETPIGAFGGTQAQVLKEAGQNLDKASDNLFDIYRQEARIANEIKTEGDLNTFIAGKQKALTAFAQTRGEDTIKAAPGVTDQLLQMKDRLLSGASNKLQRIALSQRLDAQFNEATSVVNQHVATQSVEWQKNVIAGRQELIRNEAARSDDKRLADLAMASESAARDLARTNGLTGSEAETAMVVAARSRVFVTAIEERINTNNPRQALTLFDKVKDGLDAKDREALAAKMKSVQADVRADDWIYANTPNRTRQQARQFFEAKGYGAEAASALAGNFQWESGLRTDARNPKDGRDGSDSIGIGQWNADRARALMKFAADNNLDPSKIETQLEFANHELDTTESKWRDSLKGAKTIEDASAAAMGFFRPAGWTAQNPLAGHGATGRLDNARAALADTGVGFDKAGMEAVAHRALADTSLAPAERAIVYQKLQREITVTEAARASQIKGLDDTLQATTQAMILPPAGYKYKKGTLSQIAEAYEASGDKSKAINTRFLAEHEDLLLGFAQSPATAQKRIIEGLLPGKAKALASGLLAADTKEAAEAGKQARKEAAEAGKQAREELAGLKTAAAANLDMKALAKKAAGAVDLATKANDRVLQKEIFDFFQSHVAAQNIGQAPALDQQKYIDDLRAKIEAGQTSNEAIDTVRAAQQIQEHQRAAFAKDAFATGTQLYPEVGPAKPIDDMAGRVAQARKIAAMRGGGIDVIPFTAPEIDTIRQQIGNGTPELQAKTFRSIAAGVPADMVPHVAAAIAGKHDAGDALSRSYAAALSFYAEKDPASGRVADQILQGARIIKEMGSGERKPPTSDQAWKQALQDRMGNIFRDMSERVPALFEDAIASVYTYQMHQAGRQGEKIDTDVLEKATLAVLGKSVTRNGQAFLPPVRGMDHYDVDRALRTLTDADVQGLRTTEGDPITADRLIRYGTLTNAGREGIYFVRLPDPRATLDPRHVVDPKTQKLWQLDLRPLIERAKAQPPGYGQDDQTYTGMRRRQVVPTLADTLP